MSATAQPPRRRPPWWKLVAALALTAGAIELARRQFPDLSSLSDAANLMNPWWAALAVCTGTASQLAFSYQQRVLLGAFDVELRRRDAIALTYSGGAISMVAPAGAAVAAAYTFRHYQRRGATAAVATVVTLLSGVISVLSLVLLYGVGALVVVSLPSGKWEPAGTEAVAAVLLAAVLAVAGWRFRRAAAKLLTRWAATTRLVNEIRRAVGAARAVRGREWAAVMAFAAGKWALDLACLMAVAATFEAQVGWVRLAGVYLTMQVIRQVPLTPGGIGLIEASLLAGLVAAGATTATAVVIVLAYRLITFWLTLPAGVAAHLYLRTPPETAARSTAGDPCHSR
ncbi:lysylphosphatidylglycerol synthase transmembrane domain-containing protein [Actinoplanes derwentensis]|uniref:Lysylphosphatidylglycerol synthase TM region n=1 Tax=Actinoplanes derwentensis TaxID=113562 RepID=A0A1H1XB44_9ACTN|nr:YbhN family protein [Actinoplanes derwentensis]GID89630.1 membrane protein [Actinoplanes derwentensis]SDT06573.1 hypothetical protein SAMN04489716_2407 [Actinoplanes derwentensis]